MKLAIGLVLVVTGTSVAAAAGSEPAGSLNLRARLLVTSDGTPCPPEVASDTTDCRARVGGGLVPGLGTVTETYTWAFRVGPPTCPASGVRPLASTVRLEVEGRGELLAVLAEGSQCVDLEPVRNEPQDFTITGGSGMYVGASGSGRVARSIGDGRGTETWTGTLEVPGLEFDLTPPVISGAVNKKIAAKKAARNARVVFRVTAKDDRDGALPVTCDSKSGTRFRLGRTRVTCSATDTSANSARASFTITVKKGR